MSGTLTATVLPETLWNDSGEFPQLVRDALACERRQYEGAALPDDDARYAMLCRRIEEKALADGNAARTHPDLDAYTELAKSAHERRSDPKVAPAPYRALATFFPPHEFVEQAALLGAAAKTEEARLLVETLSALSGGIVLLPSMHSAGAPEPVATPGPDGWAHAEPDSESWPDWTVDVLVSAFERAPPSPKGRIVNVGPLSNLHVAEALNRLAYDRTREPAEYTLRFQDATPSLPLRLHCLEDRPPLPPDAPLLRVALMSHRHFDLDHQVDLNWFRNVEVSTGEHQRDIEQRCYAETRRLLTEYGGQALRIEVHQTGFLPVVVGFYRGLIETLASDPGRFEVRTVLQSGRELVWS